MSMGTEPSSSPPAFAMQEATGDSESDFAAADGGCSFIDADDGDAESCSGEDDAGDSMGCDAYGTRRLVSWGCWMLEMSASSSAARHVAVASDDAGGEDAWTPSDPEGVVTEEEDAESGRLFWEECIANGY